MADSALATSGRRKRKTVEPAVVTTRSIQATQATQATQEASLDCIKKVVVDTVAPPQEHKMLPATESAFLANPDNWNLMRHKFMSNWGQGKTGYQKAVNFLQYHAKHNITFFAKLVNFDDKLFKDRMYIVCNWEEITSGTKVGSYLFKYGVGEEIYATKEGQNFVAQIFSNDRNHQDDSGSTLLQLLATNKNEVFVTKTLEVLGAGSSITCGLVDSQHLIHRGVANLNLAFLCGLKNIYIKSTLGASFHEALIYKNYNQLMPIHHIAFPVTDAIADGETVEEFDLRVLEHRNKVFEWVKYELDNNALMTSDSGWQINNNILALIRKESSTRYRGGMIVYRCIEQLLKDYKGHPTVAKFATFFGYRLV